MPSPARPSQNQRVRVAAADLLGEVGDLYRDARRFMWRKRPITNLCAAFYRGLQWGESTIFGFEVGEIDQNERREMYNYIRAIVRSEVAAILRTDPNPEAVAAYDDPLAMARAAATTQLARSFLRNDVFPYEVRYRARLAAAIHGAAWLKTCWDPNRGRPVGRDKYGNALFEGQISVGMVSILDALPDPNGIVEGEVHHLFHQKLIPLGRLEDLFPLDAFGESTEGRWDRDMETGSSMLDPIERPGQMGGERATKNQLGLLVEFWEKPSRRYPGGRFVAFSGGMLIAEGPMPCEWPWDMVYGANVVPAALYPDGTVIDIIPLQRTMNLNATKQAEWMNKLLNPPLLEPRGADLELEEWSDVAGAVVRYSQGFMPKWMDTPPIPPSSFSLFEQCLKAMKDVSTQSDVSRGELPPGAGSGRALAFLDQFESGVHQPDGEMWHRTVTGALRKALRIARDRYEDGRLVSILGEGGRWAAKAFRRDDYDFDAELVIEGFSAAPQSRALRYQEVTEGKTNGLFDDTPEAERARRMLGWDWAGRSTSDPDEQDRSRARSENTAFLEDPLNAELLVLDADNDDIHIEEHRLTRISARYLALPLQLRARFEEHARQHEEKRSANLQSFAGEQQMLGTTQAGPPPPAQPGMASPPAGGHSAGEPAAPALLAHEAQLRQQATTKMGRPV